MEREGWSFIADYALVDVEDPRDARIAELEATLANDRGEGEPPATGWKWAVENGEGTWRRLGDPARADVHRAHRDPEDAVVDRHRWHWWVVSGSYEEPVIYASGWEDTAREAMRATDAAFAALVLPTAA